MQVAIAKAANAYTAGNSGMEGEESGVEVGSEVAESIGVGEDGSVTVVTACPEASPEMVTVLPSYVAVAVKVAVPLTSRLRVVLMSPLCIPPVAQLEPTEALHSQLTPLRDAGKVSRTTVPVTFAGPWLTTLMV